MKNKVKPFAISHNSRHLIILTTILILTLTAGLTWMVNGSASPSTALPVQIASSTDSLEKSAESSPAVAPSRDESVIGQFSVLAAKAASTGMVRVIVGIGNGNEPGVEVPKDRMALSTPEEIEAAQESLLSQLSGYDPSTVKRFRYIPFLALKVSPEGLESLRGSTRVRSIQEDSVLPPAIARRANEATRDGIAEKSGDRLTGAGQAVVVIDTGIDKTQPYLAGKVVAEACFSTNDPGAGVSSLCPAGTTATTADNSALPCPVDGVGCEQGTSVAGILAGRSAGFEGIAPGAGIVAMQVFSRLEGTDQCANGSQSCIAAFDSDLISALERVFELREKHPIAAVTLSLAGGRFTSNCDEALPATKAAIDLLRRVGIPTVVASGSGGFTDALSAPACISSAISVGATTRQPLSRELVDPATNSSTSLLLLAPGETIPESEGVGRVARGLSRAGGTSMAAPHVAGFFALAKERRPGIGVGTVLNLLKSTGEEILDQRNGITIPRVQLNGALEALDRVAAAPATPSGLFATAVSATQVNLSWNDVADETSYEIYRRSSLNGTATLIAEPGANITSFENTGLTPGRTYYYYIIAKNGPDTGDRSAPSDLVRATTQPVPLAPTNLTATVISSSQINLSWIDNATNEKGYSIRRSLSSGGPYTEVTTVGPNVSTYENGSLVSGTTYYFIVVAINGGAESVPSNQATGATPEVVPLAPSGLTVSIVQPSINNQLNLSWTDNSNNETSFRIERRTGSGAFTSVGTVAANTSTFTNTGLVKNTQYFYRVYAVNSVGDSAAASNEASGTTPDDPPSAPTTLTADAASASAISLAWADNSGNETSFRVFRKIGSGGSYPSTPTAIVAANVTSYQDNGLIDDTNYFYRVVATNSGGDSAGVEANATTLPLPDPPSGLTVTTGTATKLNLTWTDNSDSPKNETGFRIKRSLTPGGPYTTVKTVGADLESAEDTDLTPVTTYYYVVVAFNANGESEASPPGSGTTAALPAAPTSVTATANSSSQITVTWSENISDDQGFEVWRKSGAGAYALLATTSSGATSYVDTNNLSGKQSYTYQVITINPNGKSLPAESNTVTTPAGPPARPTNLVATAASGTSITLTWSDNSGTETSFIVERSLTSGSGFSVLGSPLPANTITITDPGLTSGTTYFYRVRAYKSAESPDPEYFSDYSNEASATPPPIPNAPTGLTVTAASATSIDLTWSDNSSNESGFRIRRRTGLDPFSLVGTAAANATSFSDTTVSDGTNYEYSVNAYNIAGDSSSISGNATTPLPTPTGVGAAPFNATTIRVTWTDNSTSETSFRVERRPSGSGSFQIIAPTLPTNTTIYQDSSSDLVVDTNYDYRVTAVNATVTSAASATATGKLLPLPAAVTGLNATTNSTNAVQLTWTDASTNESGFRISRKTGSAGTYASVGTVNANITTFSNTGLTEGVEYFYRVTAFNVSGDSVTSPERQVTTRSNAPSNLTATIQTSTSLRLNWVDNSANETGYSLRRRFGANSFTEIVQLPANTTTYTDSGLTAGTEYFYRIFAINGGGLSAPSEDVSETPPVLPAKVGNLSASANASGSPSRVTLTWNDTANETGFKIQRAAASTGPWTTIRTNAAGVTTWEDATVIDNSTYHYQVIAFNAGGDGPPSDSASATTPSIPPAAPTGLVATRRSQTQITLTWNDNSGNETGFQIQRKTGSGAFTPLTPTLAANTTIFNDTGLTADTTYTYKVVATNSAGSNESNEATATTGTTPAAPTNLNISVLTSSQLRLIWNDNSLNEIGFRIRRRADLTSAETVVATVTATNTTTSTYTDTNLRSGTTYYYTVTAYDDNGESLAAGPINARTPDTFPIAPSGVTATAVSAAQVNVSWVDNSDNETSFVVQRRAGAGVYADVSALLPADTTTFSDTNALQPQTEYTYRIVVNNILTTSTSSPVYSTNEATVTTPIAPPATPSGFTATIVSSFQLNLAWVDSGANETGYRLYRKVGTSTDFELYQTLPANAVSFQDFGLEEGETYTYRLAAFNSAGESTPLAEASKTMPVLPGTPTLTVSKKTSTSLELTWVEGGGVETGFRIFRRTGSSGNFSQVGAVGANILTFVDIGLTTNTTYQYYVVAFNDGGASEPGSPIAQTTPVVPPAPIIGTLTGDSYDKITVNWTYPNSGQNDHSGFIVQRSNSAGGPFTLVVDLPDPTRVSYQDTALISNRTYYYRVLAKTPYDQSLPSGVGNATTNDGPPDVPNGLVATVTNGSTITLTWVDTSNNETHFKVQRSEAGTGNWTEFPDNIMFNVNTFADTTPTPGQRYDYRVKSVNTNATPTFLDWSNTANAAIPSSAPPAPTALAASSRTPTSIALTWSFDPASVAPETSILITRKVTTAADTPVLIATIPSAASGTYTDSTGLTEGTGYTYTVQSKNVIASSSLLTLPSSTRPNAPASLAATVNTFTSVNLTWVDNSSKETGFRVYLKQADDLSYIPSGVTIGPNATRATLSGLVSGVIYNFKVVALNGTDESADSNEVNLPLPTQPNAPTALVATTNQTSQATRVSQIDLTWADNSTGENGFRIERRSVASPTYALVTTVGPNVRQFSNTGLVSGTTYTYRVAAFNDGGLSSWSNESTAETEGFPPSAPTELTASAVSGSVINLAWVDNSENELGFRIQRRQIPTNAAPGSWLTVATVNANVRSFQNINLIPGRRYAFRVIAFNNDGDAVSNEAIADTPQTVPAAPGDLVATPISGVQINLTWADNSGNEEGFRIMRKGSLSGTFTQLATVLNDVKTYQDTGLTPNTRYYYQVIAFNSVGDSAPTSETSASTLVAPNAPTNLVATVVSSTQIDLSWTDNATNEVGFRIQRRIGTNPLWVEVATVGANVRTYQNIGLTAGQTYIYRVVAYTTVSDSAPTNEVSATTPVGVPAAPGNLQAVTISTSQINLSWADNSNNETGFIIRRKTGVGGTYADVGTTAANITAFQNTGLASGVTYYYLVVATNSNGNSGPSNESFATTTSGGSQVPAAPSSLVATAVSATQIDLTWNDNSANETGFRIRRRAGIDGSWSDVANTASDVKSYSDTALSPATTYYYAVRATNAAGDSVLSNEANATTSSGSTTPLAPPANLTVTAMTVTSTRLNWTDTSGAETGFRVQRRLGTAGSWIDVATLQANSISYEDTGLQSNSSYTYRVVAFNGGSNSDPSNEHPIVMPSFDFVPLSNGIAASDVVSRNQSKYYRIYIPSGVSELTVQTTGNSNVNLYVRFERQPSVTSNCRSEGATSTELCRLLSPNPGDWHIQVLGGASTTTSNFTVTASFQGSGVTVPVAPSQLVATPVSASQVNLTWIDNSTNETGFRIRRRLQSSATWTLIHTTSAPNVISYQDTSLSPGTAYVYYVTAINITGESANSNESTATTLNSSGTVPTAPGSLVASTVSSSQIRLTWTDSSNNETGFRIRRRSGSTGTYSDVGTVASNITTFLNTGLTANTTYTYQVIAFNDSGNSTGSNESSATTSTSGGGGIIPDAPSELRVTAASVSSVNLTWTDNAPNETGFRVERRLGSGEWVLATSLGVNVSSWQDVGLISGATFSYRVTAFNTSGSSANSGERSITIPSFNFTTLTNKVPLTSSVNRGASKYYLISVPEGMRELVVETTGTFDPNLYLRHERQPTEIAYSCRSINTGPVERCRILSPLPGDWHILIIGSGSTTSNFTLTATINEPEL